MARKPRQHPHPRLASPRAMSPTGPAPRAPRAANTQGPRRRGRLELRLAAAPRLARRRARDRLILFLSTSRFSFYLRHGCGVLSPLGRGSTWPPTGPTVTANTSPGPYSPEPARLRATYGIRIPGKTPRNEAINGPKSFCPRGRPPRWSASAATASPHRLPSREIRTAEAEIACGA